MVDPVGHWQHQIGLALEGPRTGLIVRLRDVPTAARVAVLRAVLRERPLRWPEGFGPEASRDRHRMLAFDLLEHVFRALEAFEAEGSMGLARRVAEWRSSLVRSASLRNWLPWRAVVLLGFVPEPDDVDYHKGFWLVEGLDELRGDPEQLGEPLRRLFTLAGDRELSFANVDKYTKSGTSWTESLVTLAGTGEVDRRWLLAESLAALQRDFPAYRATWFARLHDALSPTEAERRRHIVEYLRLCASRIPQVQAFGVRALGAAVAAGATLTFAQFGELEPIWSARQKGVVKIALELAAGVAATADEHRHEVVHAIARGLEHADADVQMAAWRTLTELDLSAPELQRIATDALPALAPRVRKFVAKAMDAFVVPASAAPKQVVAIVASMVPASPAPPQRIVPIASFDELVRELSALVGGAADPLVLERCLDGIVRLAAWPIDFAARTAGLRRIAARDGKPRLQFFVRAWLAEGTIDRDELPQSVGALLGPRLDEVLALARASPGLPLLALPSLAPCTVTAADLVQRLTVWSAAQHRPGSLDLQQALRRVAPRERAELRRTLPATYAIAAAEVFAALPAPVLDVHLDHVQSQWGKRAWYWRRTLELQPSSLPTMHPFVAPVNAPEALQWCPNESESALLLRAFVGMAPHDTELLAAVACTRIGRNVDGDTVARDDIAFLEPWLLPATPFGEHSLRLLAIALFAKAPEMHGIAIDVVLQALAEGRLHAAELGAATRQLFELRFAAMARLARSLRTIADADPVALAFVGDVLEATLAGGLEDLDRDLAGLLGLLADVLASLARSVLHPAAREFLRAVAAAGGGKAAALAKGLIATS